MSCAACGAELVAGARFCPSCGAAQDPACAACGSTLVPGARFCPSCGAAVAQPDAAEARERKVATLLFADLVGFTSLGEAKDPEVVQALVTRAFDRLSEEVRRYEGLVEKFAGDAMLAVFGVPTIHEDDPERAVRAALEMQQAMAALAAELRAEGEGALELRIGIETGEVVADLARAAGAQRDRLVTGDAVNTAARLQQSAAPGQVVVGPGTWAATRDLVVFEELEPLTLKGKAARVPAWRAVSVRTRRGGERAVLGLEAPLVGRDEELGLLKETLRRTLIEGKPHLVTVLGSAGVGKSRLTWELEKYLDGLPEIYHWRKGRCLAYGQASYSALGEAVAVDASVRDDDDREQATSKLTDRLVELGGDAATGAVQPAIEVLLGLAEHGRMSRDELFEAWREYLELVARRAPLALVLEDIHWADEGLLDFIEFLTRWAEAPILILCLARHELLDRRGSWGGGLPNAASIVLEPLPAGESARLLDGLLGGPMAGELRDRVVEVAEGNPLFTEELVRLLVDRGVLRFTDGAWQQVRPVEAMQIPPTIQALLAARLDSLPGDEKQLSQDAAVVGRIFWDQVLAHLEGRPVPDTTGILRRLRAKELVVPRQPSSLTDAAEYSFRHVLIRDVAYESVPKLERARKHRAVAAWAEERLGERREELVELLASHYLSALHYEEEFAVDGDMGLVELRRKTLEYALAAAERAEALWQVQNAARWRKVALEQGRKVDVPPLQLARLVANYMVMMESDPAELVLAEAQDAIDRLDRLDPADEDQVGLYVSLVSMKAEREYQQLGDAARAEETVRAALAALDRLGYQGAARAKLLHRLGWVYWRAGPLADAVEPLQAALSTLRSHGLVELERWPAHDLGIVLCFQWRVKEGLELLDRSLELARAAGDRGLLNRCYINIPSTLLALGGGDLQRALDLTRDGLEVARRSLDRGGQFWLANNLASIYAEVGRLAEALDLHREARSAGQVLGFPRVGLPEMTWTLTLMGRLDEARGAWAEARAMEGEPEPQMRTAWEAQEASFAWGSDAQGAVDRLARSLRQLLATDDEARGGSGTLISGRLLARMAARTGDREAAEVASRWLQELHDRVESEMLAAHVRWAASLEARPSAEHAAAIAEAAETLQRGLARLPAADAYADAAFVARAAGVPNEEYIERARALYEQCDGAPLLEPLDELREAAGEPVT